MKGQIFFVFTILVLYARGAVIDSEVVDKTAVVDKVEEVAAVPVEVKPTDDVNRNVNVGWINTGDRLLLRDYYYKEPMYNVIQSQDITYRGAYNTRITAIQVNEIGYSQFATARIMAGGVYNNTVSIRLSTAVGYGYYFLVDIWGI